MTTGTAPLRVAFLSPGWPAGAVANGIASYVGHAREGLAAHGVETRVIAAEVPSGARDPDVVALGDYGRALGLRHRLLYGGYERLRGHAANELRYGHTVARAFSDLDGRWPTDVLEVEESFGIGAVIAPLVRPPLVVRLHGPWFIVGDALSVPRDRAFVRRTTWERRALRIAAAVSSPSRHVLDEVRRHAGLDAHAVSVIPNAAPAVSEGQRWRREGARDGTILFVGRFDRVKGADLALRAFVALAPARPSATLTLVGPDRGLRDDAGRIWSFPEYLDAHVPAALRPRVRWLGERRADELAALRREAMVSVVASRFENFPMTVLETLAAGCPLVATRVGGIPEIVDDGRTGRLVPAEADALAAAIGALLDEPARAAALGSAGGRDAEQRFSPAVVGRLARDFYAEVRARHPRQAPWSWPRVRALAGRLSEPAT